MGLSASARLPEKGANHISLLIHPNAFVSSEIFFSRVLNIWHAVTFPLTVLSMCGVQNWSGFIIPSLPAWAVRVSKLDVLPEIADPKAIASSTPRKLPMDTFASFSSPSYVSDLTEETFPPFSASFASCPFIKPKSFVSLSCLFLWRPVFKFKFIFSEKRKHFGNCSSW